jgi:hypothetical protein
MGLTLLASGGASPPANGSPEQVSAPEIPELSSEAAYLEVGD